MSEAPPKIRVVTHGQSGQHTHVYALGEDGNEVEISHVVTGVEINIRVGDLNKAKLDLIQVGGEITAEIDDLVVRHLGPSRFGRLRWRLRKWWWRVKDATKFGDHKRSYA